MNPVPLIWSTVVRPNNVQSALYLPLSSSTAVAILAHQANTSISQQEPAPLVQEACYILKKPVRVLSLIVKKGLNGMNKDLNVFLFVKENHYTVHNHRHVSALLKFLTTTMNHVFLVIFPNIGIPKNWSAQIVKMKNNILIWIYSNAYSVVTMKNSM